MSTRIAAVVLFSLAACDTFAPPADESACAPRRPCSSSVSPALPTNDPTPRAPVSSQTTSTSPANQDAVWNPSPGPMAGRSGAAGQAAPVVDWNDDDAGVEPSLVSIDVQAQSIVADAKRGRIYATVAGDAPRYANSLLSIDAASSQVVLDIPIGSEPTTLALSDDGSALWVSISGAAAVRRVSVEGDELVPSDPVALPSTCFSKPCIAGSMVALPGSSERLLLVLKESTNGSASRGVLLIEKGAVRATLDEFEVSGVSALSAGPPGRAFGYNGGSSSYELFEFTISDAGELAFTAHGGLVSGYNVEITYRDGLLFATSGDVVNVLTAAAPQRVGRFPSPAAILPLPEGMRALSVAVPSATAGSKSGSLTLGLADVETFTTIKSEVIGTVAATSFRQPRNLSQARTSLAFLTGGFEEASKIYLVHDVQELQ
jgi:hypothetical protein